MRQGSFKRTPHAAYLKIICRSIPCRHVTVRISLRSALHLDTGSFDSVCVQCFTPTRHRQKQTPSSACSGAKFFNSVSVQSLTPTCHRQNQTKFATLRHWIPRFSLVLYHAPTSHRQTSLNLLKTIDFPATRSTGSKGHLIHRKGGLGGTKDGQILEFTQ